MRNVILNRRTSRDMLEMQRMFLGFFRISAQIQRLCWSRRHDVHVLLCLLILVFTDRGAHAAEPAGSPFDYCHLTSSNISIPDFFSPFHPLPYPNTTDCSKLITAPPDHVIQLDFRGRFNIEGRDCHILRSSAALKRPIECVCQYDYLEVRDGPYAYSPLIGRFCGRIFPPTLRTTGRYMRLRFRSDDAIQFEGFYAVYQNVLDGRRRGNNVWNGTDCQIFIDGKDGMVNSSQIPRKFINDAQIRGVPLDCIFEINVHNDSQILLRFTEIKLVNPKDCDMDFIDVHQSTLDVQDRIHQYCGGSAQDSRINASRAYLRFMSDPTMLNENNFNAYFTAIRPASPYCQADREFDCGDGFCVALQFECDKRPHCFNRADEMDCDQAFSWKKTTLQSVIISVVVGVIIIAILALAIFLTCHEKQISQPRRYFTPAPLRKTVTNDEFGYGCTVDEMFARSKEEELGYFVRKVPRPIVANVPISKVVFPDPKSVLAKSSLIRHYDSNGAPYTWSLPHNSPSHDQLRTPTSPFIMSNGRARSASPSVRTRRNPVVHFDDQVPDETIDTNNITLHSSLKLGIPVFMYSPNSKRKLMRVA